MLLQNAEYNPISMQNEEEEEDNDTHYFIYTYSQQLFIYLSFIYCINASFFMTIHTCLNVIYIFQLENMLFTHRLRWFNLNGDIVLNNRSVRQQCGPTMHDKMCVCVCEFVYDKVTESNGNIAFVHFAS